MDRRQLLELMPVNGQDVEGATRIIAVGYPALAPILPDMMKLMRIPESPVADTIAEFFAELGKPGAPAIGDGLRTHNIWLKHRILVAVLPKWPTEALALLRQDLSTVAAHQDLYDNDLRSMVLLASRRLVAREWLQDLLATKGKFMSAREMLLHEAESLLDRLT